MAKWGATLLAQIAIVAALTIAVVAQDAANNSQTAPPATSDNPICRRECTHPWLRSPSSSFPSRWRLAEQVRRITARPATAGAGERSRISQAASREPSQTVREAAQVQQPFA